MSKETFKDFVRNKPWLADYVKDNLMTWQKFYELYDLYGEDENIWSKYQVSSRKNKITNILENFNPDKIQEHISSAQKALDIVSELATKSSENISKNIQPNIERPINKFFGD